MKKLVLLFAIWSCLLTACTKPEVVDNSQNEAVSKEADAKDGGVKTADVEPANAVDASENKAAEDAAKAKEDAAKADEAKAKEDAANQALMAKGWIELDNADRPNMKKAISDAEWVKANNAFGLRLLGSMPGNAVVSPYSVERVTGMLLDGTKGKTATGLLKVLGMPDAKELSMTGLNIEKALLNVPKDVAVEIDNRIWLDADITEDFKRRLLVAYRGAFELGPITDVKINAKVAETTHGLIDKIIPVPFDEPPLMVLVNTIYLKAKWENWRQFSKHDTKPDTFEAFDHKQTVQMMHKTLKDRVVHFKHFDQYDIPFVSSIDEATQARYIFRIMLPNKSGKEGLALTEKTLHDKPKASKEYNVILSLPKFDFKSDLMELNDYYIENGAHLAFDNNYQFLKPEFHGITEPAYISKIYHKTVVKIDEEGGEASAATAIVMRAATGAAIPHKPDPEFIFNVNRPFLFEIIEQNTGTVLFVGRMTSIPE